MSNVLLITGRDREAAGAVEELLKSENYRYKVAPDRDGAVTWLQQQSFPFSQVLLSKTLPLSERRAIAERAWAINELIEVIEFGGNGNDIDGFLYGAQSYQGPEYLLQLERHFRAAKDEKAREAGAFRMLLVEDLDSPRDILSFYLESLGVGPVAAVNSGPEALKVLENEPGSFSCIITDIRMPGMKGDELIAKIRHNELLSRLPIIALTAHGSVDTLCDCLKAGASGFLLKPPKRDDLLKQIQHAKRILLSRAPVRLADQLEAEQIRAELYLRGFF